MSGLVERYGGLAKSAYLGFVLGGVACGVIEGWDQWKKWLRRREEYEMRHKSIESAVNDAHTTGSLYYHIILNGVVHGAVFATAPISVPLLIYAGQK